MRLLVVDHQDSFTWNLVHAFGALVGAAPEVVDSRALPVAAVVAAPPDLLILSPGPGHPAEPRDAGRTLDLLRQLPRGVPCFGVCFGLQLLAVAAGARVVPAIAPVHGKSIPVRHDGHALFAGIASGAPMMRYHSLVADPASLAPPWRAIGWSPRGEVMALAAEDRPTWAVQFHPESIGSPDGPRLLANVLACARSGNP